MWFLLYFILYLLIYTLLRLEFLVWNWSSLKNLTSEQLVLAFVNGIRFDLSALAPTLGFALLGAVLLCHWPRVAKGWLWLFAVLNAAFFAINAMDAELYNFTAKRFAWSSFFLASEAHVTNVILPYLPLALASFCIVLLFGVGSFFLIRRFQLRANAGQKALISFLIIVVSVLASRGGLQHKPLTYVDAKIFDNTYGNNLVLNSTFTIIKSASKKSLERLNVANQDEMLAQLNPRTEQDFKVEPTATPLNIVIVILESFSEEYSQLRDPEVMPYFNRLRLQSVDFKKAYANGRRSIEGIAAILSGIPALMEEPFIDSEFSANQVIGLGNLLTQHGYKTSFFHAANKGSMHFDSFSRSVGVEKYYAREDYPNKIDDDGTWGIFDEPFLKWTCAKLTSDGTPFMSTIFTLSSHQPYNLPPEHRSLKDDRLEILKSIKYTDYSLEQFMKCAEQQPWFKNTLFVFTADHTGPELKPNTEFKKRYEIPMLLYGPSLSWLKKFNTNQYAQQIDVLPTLLDILNIEQKNVNYLSRSLLRSGPKIIPLYSDGTYELVGDIQDKEAQLKAVQQYFSQGLYDNRLYYPTKK